MYVELWLSYSKVSVIGRLHGGSRLCNPVTCDPLLLKPGGDAMCIPSIHYEGNIITVCKQTPQTSPDSQLWDCTSLMAAQNLLCRTLCRACSLGGGSSPLRCSRSNSSITLHTSNTYTHRGHKRGWITIKSKHATAPEGPRDSEGSTGLLCGKYPYRSMLCNY